MFLAMASLGSSLCLWCVFSHVCCECDCH